MEKTNAATQNALETDHQEWDSTANHPLQSWAWGDFREKMGITVARIPNGQLTFHNIPYTSWTIGYFPKGPLPDKQMLLDLRRLGKEKKAIYIQLEPNVEKNLDFPPSNFENLRQSHHPLFTKHSFILDITPSEDDLLKSFHSKTRYNIQLAKRHGVTIQEDNSQKAFQAYLDLSQETTQRQGFYAHNTEYQKTMWQTMRKAGIARLFSATYHDMTLASWIIFQCKNTIYYPYGASNRQHREVMAPTLLLWDIARRAKSEGYKFFDLWGGLGPNPNPADPWYGFHRFKQGFNPRLVEYLGSYDLVIHPLLYQSFIIADKIRWILLNGKLK